MDDFQKLRQKATIYAFAVVLGVVAACAGVYVGIQQLEFDHIHAVAVTGLCSLLFVWLGAYVLSRQLLKPFHALWQAILHVAPDTNSVPAPNVQKLRMGRELVTSLAARVYQFASQQDSAGLVEHRTAVLQAVNVVNHFPLPIFACNKDQQVTNASESALNYVGVQSSELFGKPLFDNLFLDFSGDTTLQQWITECQASKAIDQAYWQRVKVRQRDGKTTRQCDIAAYYNRDNPSGTEFIVTLFDHTESYQQDDQSLSFVALAVHELRTPLTMLRGYVEVFEEELANKLNPELTDYLYKMRLSADQLAAFVNNILNVVKVEANQLSLRLVEGDWEHILRAAATSMQLRAQVLGKIITFQVAPNLPKVAVDPVSMSEVVNNLLDNALKYSGSSQNVNVTVGVNQEGFVETTVQDFGVGIPASVLPNLFEKFYRNHRTRAQVGGTGLGLYLSKALVNAHGGQIWVKSKEGEGTTFGFTLKPYAVAEAKERADEELVHQAHGWIKNHSYNRR